MKITTCLTLLVGAITVADAARADLVFTKIVDTSTVAPGGAGTNFRSLSSIDIDGGEILFRGQDSTTNGWFTSQNGVIRRAIDSTVTIPGTTNRFSTSSSDIGSISNGRIAITQRGGTGGSFVVEPDGSITEIVRVGDVVPIRGGTFTGFGGTLIDGDRMVTRGNFSAFGAGLYESTGEELSRIFDTQQNLNLPGINDSLRSFGLNDIEGETTLFLGGRFNSQDGFYTIDGDGSVSTVVDINTAIPEGTGTFTGFDSRFAQMDNGDVVFFGRGDDSQLGIYVSRNGVLSKVADRSDGFVDLRAPVISGDRIFFQGGMAGTGTGIYEFHNGSLTEVIGNGDILDGRSISILQNQLAVDDNTLVFMASTGIGASAIYSTQFSAVPEPGSFAMMLLTGAVFVPRRRRNA